MPEDLTTAIRAAEQRRCDAMLANDSAALDAILDPRLHFAHATGVVDDKAAYLAKMAAGRIEYVGIAWTDEAVEELAGGIAMLTGKMTTEVKVEGLPKTLNNRVLMVWGESASAWRVIAFQSTPMAG
jgi:hypothetical protein